MAIKHELAFEHIRFGNWWHKIVWSIRMKTLYGIDTSYPDYYWLWEYVKNKPLLFDKSIPQPVDYILRPRVWQYTLEEEEWIESHIEDFKTKNVSIALNFFFQSSLIVRGIEKEICEFFEFKDEVVDRIKEKYKEVFTKPVISLGVRLGDFQNHGDFFQIPFDWYTKALVQEFPDWYENYNVLVLSDDINKAKEIFKGCSFYYADFNDTASHRENFKYYHGDVHEQWLLGTLSSGMIISNSTFSLAQAHMSYMLRGAKIVHCGEVFRGKRKQENDITHYYHKDWINVKI